MKIDNIKKGAGEAKPSSKYSPAGPDTGGLFARPSHGYLYYILNGERKQERRQRKCV